MLVLNDLHLGVQRKGGTTPASQEALRNYLFTSLEEILHDSQEKHLVIAGDLFDEFEVSPRDWVQTYLIFQDWLVRSGGKLTLIAGNHDHSPKALRVSSFEMLSKVLVEQFGDQVVTVVGIDQWSGINPPTGHIYALAHCSNQDVFNAKLNEVLAQVVDGDGVFLHANFDNHFAAQSDHSLNVSMEQAKKFAEKGATLFFAHEHQARTALGGRVVVFGNQWPTSIADCLNNDEKYAHVFNGGVTKVRTWAGASGRAAFLECDWRTLMDEAQIPGLGFIRVTGKASAAEASDCLNAIAKFRQRSSAFVISNAVQIEGLAEIGELPSSFEAAKRFDVLEFIREKMEPEEVAMLEKLVEAQQ